MSEQTELSNLLAIMHGDGGHHQQKVGTKQAIIDAIELIHTKWVTNEALQDINLLSEQVATLKETLAFDAACKTDLEFRINELEQLLKMCIVRCTDAKMTSALYKEIRAALKLP